MKRLWALALALVFAAACGPAAPAPVTPPASKGPLAPSAAEDARSWELYLFDVGTGLALLVRGEDFALLYDGGSNDDRARGADNRLLAYLQAVLGRSGGAGCRPDDGEALPERPLDHVVASHPHRDHIGLLPDVLGCFAVGTVYDSGYEADTDSYGELLGAVAREAGVTYRSGRAPSPGREIAVRGKTHALPSWKALDEGEVVPLGRGARATVLATRHDAGDANDASIVLRLDLGRTSVLLTGDATGGRRASPQTEPSAGSTEHALLARHRRALDVDVLQVGHHGSLTSSRALFLDAVRPAWALVSSGPMRYGSVVLPDREVVGELERRGARVLRTDVDDEGCRTRADKVGPAADGKPGGCDARALRLHASGRIEELSQAAARGSGELGGGAVRR